MIDEGKYHRDDLWGNLGQMIADSLPLVGWAVGFMILYFIAG